MTILLSVIVLQGIVYGLSLRGHHRRALQIDVLFLWLVLLQGGYMSGGIYASSTLLYFIPLILAATTVSVRFTTVMTILIIVGFCALYFVEVAGLLPIVPERDLPYRMIILIVVFVITTLVLSYHMLKMYESERETVDLSIMTERLRVQQRLTQDLAHDLRTPFSVLTTHLYVLKRRHEKGQNISESLSILEAHTQKLQHMMEGFLELSRLDGGGSDALETLQYLNVVSLMEKVLEEHEPYAQRQNIRLSMQKEHSEIAILGDKTQLDRVFSNLIENGIHYGKENGQVTVAVSVQNSSTIVKIADDGIGIATEHHEQIFERFFRVDEARTMQGRVGSGIGLSIVKRIVELHGGTVTVESAVGNGSTFMVTLPLATHL